MKPSEVLTKARSVIADPSAWCQGIFARRADGMATGIHSSNAAQWCAVGALFLVNDAPRATPDAELKRVRTNSYLSKAAAPMHPGKVNDELGHEAVMGMYERAIAMAVEAGE